MAQKISIKKNFVMNIILTLSSIIFPIISFPYVSRVLGPGGTGEVDFATSIIGYFALFSQLGIPTYGVRAVAHVRDNKEKLSRTVHELLTINLVMSLIVYAVLIPTLFIVPKFSAEKPLFLVLSLTILLNSIGMEYLYKGLEQYSYITIRSVIFKVIAFAAMFAFVHEKTDYVIYGGITILAASASNVLNLFNARKLITFKRLGGYNYRQHLKAVAIFFSMACATTIYLHLDTLMLGFMTTKVDVGYYGASVKIKNILVALVTSLGNVLLPRASYYVENHQMDEFKRITAKAMQFVFVAAVPLMIYFIIFSRQGILFLSGEKYIPAIPAMMIIMPTLFFIGITNILGIQILVPLGKEKYVLYSEIWGAVTDLILNLILIPKFKAAGAAIGTVTAEFVVLAVQLFYMNKLKEQISVKKLFKRISYGKILIACSLATIASIWVRYINIPLWEDKVLLHNLMLIAVSAIPFFGVYGLSMIIMKDEMVTDIFNTVMKKVFRR